MSLEDDVKWLISICKKPASLKYLEPSAHAFSILFSLQNVSYSEEELAKLSMMGIVATTARLNDAEKFHTLDPQSFLQVANLLLDEEDNGEKYTKLLEKITQGTNINTIQEEDSHG